MVGVVEIGFDLVEREEGKHLPVRQHGRAHPGMDIARSRGQFPPRVVLGVGDHHGLARFSHPFQIRGIIQGKSDRFDIF